jgi:TDG/mug DNA glycosylase family protein
MKTPHEAPDPARLSATRARPGLRRDQPRLYSVRQGHYFARSTNRFWPAFTASRLSRRIRDGLASSAWPPEHDGALLGFGHRLHRRRQARLGQRRRARPRRLRALGAASSPEAPPCGAARGVLPRAHRVPAVPRPGSRIDGRVPVLGPQPEVMGSTRLFVVPNPSPPNAHISTLGRSTSWYDRLADFLGPALARHGLDGRSGARSRFEGLLENAERKVGAPRNQSDVSRAWGTSRRTTPGPSRLSSLALSTLHADVETNCTSIGRDRAGASPRLPRRTGRL